MQTIQIRAYYSYTYQVALRSRCEIDLFCNIRIYGLFISCTSESSPYKANSWEEDWKGEI